MKSEHVEDFYFFRWVLRGIFKSLSSLYHQISGGFNDTAENGRRGRLGRRWQRGRRMGRRGWRVISPSDDFAPLTLDEDENTDEDDFEDEDWEEDD